MSDHVGKPHHENRELGEQSIHSYQAAWMAHWDRAQKETSLAQSNLPVDHKPMEGNSVPATMLQLRCLSRPDAAADASYCGSKEFTEVPVAGPSNVPDEGVTVVSAFSREKRLEQDQPFPEFGFSQSRDSKSIIAIKDDQASFFYDQPLGSQFNSKSGLSASPRDLVNSEKMSGWPPSWYETQSREHFLDLAGTSREFVEKNSLLLSGSSKDAFLASSTRYPVKSTAGRLEKVNESSSFLTAKGHLLSKSITQLKPDESNYLSSSAVFIHQQDTDPMTCKNQLAFFHGDNEFKKRLKGNSEGRFFQNQTGPFDLAEAECSSRLKNSFLDVENMRICTTISSVEGSKFHGTMKQLFFIEKKTDANLSRGGKIIRKSTVSTATQFKGNTDTFEGVLGLSENGGFKSHQQGVKLQPLWSSTDSEEKENAVDSKHESSAETNTMDMDTLKENQSCGEEVSLSNKDYVGSGKSLASLAAAGFGIPSSHQNYLELPSAIPISRDDKESSMSKTLSLDAAVFLPDADGHTATTSKSRSTQSGPDPRRWWMKRIKIGLPDSPLALGTKTSKMEEATSSPKKFNPFLRNTLKRALTSSEPLISDKSCDRKHILFGQYGQSVKKDGGSSSTSESMGKKNRDELLSHSWIRRWCRNHSQAQTTKPEGEAAFVFCDPQSMKVSLDEIQKKQLPSLAAMALMGKAMNGFRPCEFRKRGSFMVWNCE